MEILARNKLNMHKGGRSSAFYWRAYKQEIRKNLKPMKRTQYQVSHVLRKKLVEYAEYRTAEKTSLLLISM